MSSTLDFQQYIGGPDEVVVESTFPNNQKTVVYSFGTNVTGWTFDAEYQTLVVDQLAYNRATGEPNFANTSIIGVFPVTKVTGNTAPAIVNATAGNVAVTMPANMYTGPVNPNARTNVPITVFSFTWCDTSTPPQITSHRWALIQTWAPTVRTGDPTTATGYTSLV